MRKFINLITEALKPTATKLDEPTDHLFDIPVEPDTDNQQVAVAPEATPPAPEPIHRAAGAQGTRNAFATGAHRIGAGIPGEMWRSLNDLSQHVGADDISDEQARINAGHDEADYVQALGPVAAAELGADTPALLTTDGYEPVTPNTLPAVISRQLTASGDPDIEDNFDPEWHQIRHLPGYLQTAIRQIGRRVFAQFTTTPIEDIQMVCEILNPASDVQKMATWVVRNGHKEDEQRMDFSDIIPGFTADCTLWRAGGVEYLIMRDIGGHYIYAWPEDHRQMTDRNAAPGAEAPQIGAPMRRLPGA
jgi:hypothetical protein